MPHSTKKGEKIVPQGAGCELSRDGAHTMVSETVSLTETSTSQGREVGSNPQERLTEDNCLSFGLANVEHGVADSPLATIEATPPQDEVPLLMKDASVELGLGYKCDRA